MPDANVEALLAYLRENAPRFSLEALTRQMIAAGHTATTIETALAKFRKSSGADPRATPVPALHSLPPLPAISPPVAHPGPTAELPSSSPSTLKPRPAIPAVPSVAVPAATAPPARSRWWGAGGVALFDCTLAGVGVGLIKGGQGKVAWMGGCVALLAPLAVLVELLVGLILTAADGASRAGRAMLYGSLLVLGLGALALAGTGIYLAARGVH
jgi:hypothetical protein